MTGIVFNYIPVLNPRQNEFIPMSMLTKHENYSSILVFQIAIICVVTTRSLPEIENISNLNFCDEKIKK